MYSNEFIEVIVRIINGTISKASLEEYLMDYFDCEKIYDSDDALTTDLFFTLKHYASGEEEVNNSEWRYFLDCLLGNRQYSVEEKFLAIAQRQE